MTPTTKAAAVEQSPEEHQPADIEMKDANKLSSLAAAVAQDSEPTTTAQIAVTGKENPIYG
jgi:hypothetical protein